MVSGLLPLLKSIHNVTHIKKYAGQTIGIDAYGWLHRGTVACAVELALDKPTMKYVIMHQRRFSLTKLRYVDFALHRVGMLIHFGVIPYLIFDGDRLPSKAGTEHDRSKRRQECKRTGMNLYRAGKMSHAHQELQKAVDVTPYMARQLIEELKRMNIQYVVAPYEADAQMVYLERNGIINGILSEDSDLLVFGAKRLLTKLDQHGDCIEICRDQFASCKDISLVGWTDAEFRQMAILSGCDYLPNISKMGLKTAYRYVRKYQNIEKVLRMLQLEKHFIVPGDYLEQFQRAELTFLHHRVFCPIAKQLVFLTDLERGMLEKDLPFLGPSVDPETAIGVACGDLDPMTKESICSRKSAPSSRAASWTLRRQNIASEADPKNSKPIDSFFQPRRQPLAELDPNSLTPSPPQQRLLNTHRNASWEARSVASAPQMRRTDSSTPVSGSAVMEPRLTVERTAFLARAATVSTFQPMKRQRLCSAPEETSPTVKKSPFFANATEEPSPSVQRKAKAKKARRTDFDIFSDDSIEDIMLLLPDIDGPVASQQGKLSAELPDILPADKQTAAAEHGHAARGDIDTVPESSPLQYPVLPPQGSVEEELSLTETTVPSLVSESQSTMATTVSADDNPEAFEDLLETHIRMQNQALRKTFVCQSPSQREAALLSISAPTVYSISQPKVGILARTFSAQSSEQQMKALEKLVPQSESKRERPRRKSLCESFSYMSKEQQARALASLGKRQGSMEKVKLGQGALFSAPSTMAKHRLTSSPQQPRKQVPGEDKQEQSSDNIVLTLSDPQTGRTNAGASPSQGDCDGVPANAYHLATSAPNNRALGSEDFLAPDSEEEGEEISEPESGAPKIALKLQAYAFMPR